MELLFSVAVLFDMNKCLFVFFPLVFVLGGGDSRAVLKWLQTKFEDANALPELTVEENKKYVGTEADCGRKEVNPKHYESCIGFRNLRL